VIDFIIHGGQAMGIIILLSTSLAAVFVTLLPATPAQAQSTFAVFYEEDPAAPRGPKRQFVGSALWRTETISPGRGQPPELAIRADVEIPERKLGMIWSLRRNTESSVPASHMIEMKFKLQPDLPLENISRVPGMLMRQSGETLGVALKGSAVKVIDGFFLMGLSAVDADREHNVQLLLKERAWLDIPIAYSDGHRALLSIEKGTPGERVIARAFAVWRQ
jgi:hypothetical protein